MTNNVAVYEFQRPRMTDHYSSPSLSVWPTGLRDRDFSRFRPADFTSTPTDNPTKKTNRTVLTFRSGE